MPLLDFDSTDLAATEEFLSSAYTKMSIGGRAESTRAQVSREAAGRSLTRRQDAENRAANLEAVRADLRRRTDRNR